MPGPATPQPTGDPSDRATEERPSQQERLQAARSRVEELVRQFVDGRDSDTPAARRQAVAAWEELIARERPRIRGWVVTFRFPNKPEVRIAADEYDDATQSACDRSMYALVRSFRGKSYGEFLGAVRTCTRFECMDFCRDRLADDRGLAGSLQDEREAGEGDPVGRFDRELAELGRRIEEGRFESRLAKDEVDRAIEQVASEDQRRVLRLSLDGYPVAEIAKQLGTNVDNVYQLRSRGQRRLNEILGGADD